MRLIHADNWLKSPLDRDVITRWTVGKDELMTYALEFPPPPDPERFTFLALGDTGDSEACGPHLSPQDAVAQEMALDAALPGSSGQAALVVHTGDVVYMTGERRLYDRNFRQPYSAFLTPQSTVDSLVFRLPFLPVPGNHDYYDLTGWNRWLARVPLLRAGVRAIAHELFAFSLPEGGSDMGKAYMQAFVDGSADTCGRPLPYLPGEQTRLPNRYYKFRVGNVDFFAMDSNTLDAPAPSTDTNQVHTEAGKRVEALETRAEEIDRELRRHQLALERWQQTAHQEVSTDALRQTEIIELSARVETSLVDLHAVLAQVGPPPCDTAMQSALTAQRRWAEAAGDLVAATEPATLLAALRDLEDASDEGCTALRAAEECLAELPEGPTRGELLAARDALQQRLHEWSQLVTATPLEESQLIHQLSEEALDVQRELALERQRVRYRPEDYDHAQRDWLEKSLTAAIQERPNNWRIVYLHHPLFTTITNHCERPDVQGLRANLLPLLQGRVHLVLSGHSHAFEWFRAAAMPNVGIFVTGGGGQITLRPSMLEAQRVQRHRNRYQILRANGVQECAIGGRGPAAVDGEAGLLYHYLRIEVTPDTLVVRPVGVRRLLHGYRREEPMPVYHASDLPPGRPVLISRRLEGVEIRRDQPPRPLWR